MTKVQQLSAVLAALILTSILLFVFDGKGESETIDRDIFLVADTASIQGLSIQIAQTQIHLKQTDGVWTVNDSMTADPSVIRLLKMIMSQVKVQRPISPMNAEEIAQSLLQSGRKVEFNLGGESLSFYAGGNINKTQSYFASDDLKEVYLVGIPGYSNYLSGIFELSTNQWRDRILFNSDYRSIQSLTLSYPDQALEIDFKDRFFEVSGVQQIDTVALMNYLNGFEGFLLNDYLTKGSFPKYDSLVDTVPIARLRLEDIDQSKNRDLKIHAKIPGELFYLLTNAKNEMIVVDERRASALLKTAQDFKKD